MTAGAAMAGIDPHDDLRFMDLALGLGRRGLGRTWPNPAVGAVVVGRQADGPVTLGRGWTQPGGRPHAETQALARAGDAARGATLYVTLEPCSHHGQTPPCADAIVAAGIARVVSALEDPNPQVAGEGHRRMAAAGVRSRSASVPMRRARRMQDTSGACASAAPQGQSQAQRSRPAARPALAGRRPAPITGEPARARVHLMRAMSDAVLTGIGTALADDPLLTCRLPGMADRSPVRVVLDGRLRLRRDSRLVASARQTPLWVITGIAATEDREQALQSAGAEVLRVPVAGGRLDLAIVLERLAARHHAAHGRGRPDPGRHPAGRRSGR